jgi:hypothetical protein
VATSRDLFDRALSDAEALGDRIETRLMALRVCELIEFEDFDEVRRLRERMDGCAEYRGTKKPRG